MSRDSLATSDEERGSPRGGIQSVDNLVLETRNGREARNDPETRSVP